MSFRLGIDTGGTYTDAVLIDPQQRVVASAKRLTTRHDLTHGIREVLQALPEESLSKVELVALSTTLSTNSVVEGRGAPVCALLAGYEQEHVQRAGLAKVLERDPVVLLTGGHDGLGREKQPLDEKAARKAILKHAPEVAAFAVSAMFGTRNPEHEIRLRELVFELCGKPVTCGHELADSLGAPRRALTVALNARMIPTIHRLITAMQEIMRELSIGAPLMLVKGDGSLINVDTALREPVGTVLSGPAASVIGACVSSGVRNAIVADMGGTTTDIAIVSDGRPELCPEGVRIGDLEPMVEAVRVVAIGLGGDSEVHFGGRGMLVIGPRRVVPVSLLAHQHPEVLPVLRQQALDEPDRRQNRFILRLESSPELIGRLSDIEHEAWERLEDAPLELARLVREDRPLARAMARLERMGLAIYSGFTPSDAAHVLGLNDHWDAEAARLAAGIWSRQMRYIFGLGQWQPGEVEAPCERVFEAVQERIARALIVAGLHSQDRLGEAETRGLTDLLTDLVMRTAAGATPLFEAGFHADYRLVAVGAPAPVFYPAVAERLGLELVLPDGGAVANALGAGLGSVVQRASATITRPRDGVYILHGTELPRDFGSLDEAIAAAEEQVKAEAESRAVAAGAGEVELALRHERNEVLDDVDGDLFLEMRIIATAAGRPRPTRFSNGATA